MKKLLACALIAATPLVAVAQDVSQDPTLAAPSCKKPVPHNTVRRADGDEDFTENFNKYQDCVKAYVEAQNKLANAHISAANAAVADLNAFVKDMNERQGKN
jgi:hypothetical protein